MNEEEIEVWQTIYFPIPLWYSLSSFGGNDMQNIGAMRAFLLQHELEPLRDYVMLGRTRTPDNKDYAIRLKFKDSSIGTFCLLRWQESDYYRGKKEV